MSVVYADFGDLTYHGGKVQPFYLKITQDDKGYIVDGGMVSY